MLCALIHSLAGASPETVLFDYMLSRIGYEPAREQLVAYAMAHTKAGAAFARGSDSSNSSGDSDANVDIDDREIGFTNIIELRPENWDFFVAEVDRVYGRFDTSGRGRGWWGYALASHDDGGMGLTKDEIEAVRRRLTEA